MRQGLGAKGRVVWAVDGGDDFRAFQTARDAAAALLIVGSFLLLSSLSVGTWQTLATGVGMVVLGFVFAARARRIRPR